MDFTSRAALRKPTVGEFVDVGDLNANMDKVDEFAVGKKLCTSTTRPATPWVGMEIFETDTKAYGLWTGAEWSMTDTVWRPWTPSIAPLQWLIGSVSNPSLTNTTSRYMRQGLRNYLFQASATLATTGSGTYTGRLPFFTDVSIIDLPLGSGVMVDSGTANYLVTPVIPGASTSNFALAVNANGNNASQAIPFATAVNDRIIVTMSVPSPSTNNPSGQ